MRNTLNRVRAALLVGGMLAMQSVLAAADRWQMNMYQGVTPISKDMYHLHMVALLICAVIGLIVFGVMFYSLVRHRKSKGYQAATFHDNSRLEIIWSIIPFIILIGLAVPATSVLMHLEDTSNAEVTIKVVGYQWRWQYDYLDQGIRFFSTLSTPYRELKNRAPKGEWYLLEVDNPVVVPVNKKIRFLVTANDVVHSWWVPELGIKRDAIPGFMHEAWATIEKPGVYRGQCTELCGINHGFMPIVVKAVSEAEFEQWVALQPKVEDKFATGVALKTKPNLTRAELMKRGRTKYRQLCAACHRDDGRGLPPLFPALRASSVAVGYPISRHIDMILQGVSGSAMQPYRDQLSDEEVAAIVTYERNAWGNNTNDVVQPADVASVRQDGIQLPKLVNKAQAGGLR